MRSTSYLANERIAASMSSSASKNASAVAVFGPSAATRSVCKGSNSERSCLAASNCSMERTNPPSIQLSAERTYWA